MSDVFAAQSEFQEINSRAFSKIKILVQINYTQNLDDTTHKALTFSGSLIPKNLLPLSVQYGLFEY